MMLQALIAYAEREGLGDPDFEPIGVRRLISVTRDGRLASVIPLSDDVEAKKPKPKRLIRPKSDPDFVSHGRAYFLCDNVERCLLFVDDPDKLVKRRINQSYFLSLLDEAAKECPGEAASLRAVITLLTSEEQMAQVHGQLGEQKASSNENAAFTVDGAHLLNSDELKRWWRNKAAKQRAGEEALTGMCLATSAVGPLCRTTGFIKLLGEDTKLISFNKECPAFESLGLSQAANAPVSADAEMKFREALNRLIDLSRRDGLVWNNTVHLHWTREPVPDDPIDALLHANPDDVKRLRQGVQTGKPPLGIEANAYYAMSLSGNGARIIVRDWLEATIREIAEHVAEWFDDLAIIDRDGVTPHREFKFGALLYGMVRADLDELSPQLPTQLFHGALRGRGAPLPQTALAAALRRQQLDQDDKLKPTRLALIKACLLRSPNKPNPNTAMSEKLNESTADPAYLCGRLFAVFDRLQYLALGGVNAGVVERYYASASVTPSLVMGRLFRNAQFHLAKADGGAAENVRKDFETLASALGERFPATLDLEAQGRFALGYYHQKADYRRRSTQRKEAAATTEAASA